jgi:tetratricopeptide (TPR) repeat protein
MDKSLDKLVQRYEAMVGQERSVYFDADQIEQIAYAYESKEDFAEALKVVNYGLTLHPANTNLLLCKAKYLLFLDCIDEAGKLLPLLPPGSEEATLIRIEYAFACGRPEEGFALINEQMEQLTWEFALDTVSILWGYVGYNEIIDFLKRALERLPDEPNLLLELANIYQDNDEPAKAIELYNRLLDIDPYQTAVWYELGRSYSALRRFDKAIEACDFALAIDHDYLDALSLKGFALYDADRVDEALAVFLEFADKTDDPGRAIEYISDCYIKLERIPEAIEELEKGLKLNPESQYVLYQLAYCNQDMGNTPKAKEYLHRTLLLNKNQLDCWLLLGEILMQEENYEEAFDAYNHALIIDADNVDLLATLGDLCERLDRMDKAVEYYEQAHRLHRYDIKLVFRLLLSYYATGQMEKAAELSKEINSMTELINADIDAMTDQERHEIREASNMVDSLRRLLHEIISHRN